MTASPLSGYSTIHELSEIPSIMRQFYNVVHYSHLSFSIFVRCVGPLAIYMEDFPRMARLPDIQCCLLLQF